DDEQTRISLRERDQAAVIVTDRPEPDGLPEPPERVAVGRLEFPQIDLRLARLLPGRSGDLLLRAVRPPPLRVRRHPAGEARGRPRRGPRFVDRFACLVERRERTADERQTEVIRFLGIDEHPATRRLFDREPAVGSPIPARRLALEALACRHQPGSAEATAARTSRVAWRVSIRASPSRPHRTSSTPEP